RVGGALESQRDAAFESSANDEPTGGVGLGGRVRVFEDHLDAGDARRADDRRRRRRAITLHPGDVALDTCDSRSTRAAVARARREQYCDGEHGEFYRTHYR